MIVTRPNPACGRPLVRVVEECVRSGATAVELRDKAAAARELYEVARELRVVTRRHDVLFVVNDRFDVARAAEADGAHLGPEDPPVSAVRRVVPLRFVLGYSTDDPGEARRAARAGADYLGVGAVYGTRTKLDVAGERVGPARVAEVLRAAELPGVGIGGITAENAAAVAAAGAGVAVSSAVMGAEDPGRAVRAILDSIRVGARRGRDSPGTSRGG